VAPGARRLQRTVFVDVEHAARLAAAGLGCRRHRARPDARRAEHGRRAHAAISRTQHGHPAAVPTR